MKIQPNKLRQRVLDMIYRKGSGHIGASFSIAELIAYLYSNYDLTSLEEKSDKLILSKGHGVPVVYAALREMGVLTDDDLDTFREVDSALQGHPDRLRLPYMHATTGSLGQGLSIAIGHALAMRLKGYDNKVFCILGDGEMQEGQIWEALMLAPKYKLSNLICFVDCNRAQNDGYVKDILDNDVLWDKIDSFGWNTSQINGHCEEEIKSMLNTTWIGDRPQCIIMDTVKGKGVSFMENAEWHAKVPNEEEYNLAMGELV